MLSTHDFYGRELTRSLLDNGHLSGLQGFSSWKDSLSSILCYNCFWNTGCFVVCDYGAINSIVGIEIKPPFGVTIWAMPLAVIWWELILLITISQQQGNSIKCFPSRLINFHPVHEAMYKDGPDVLFVFSLSEFPVTCFRIIGCQDTLNDPYLITEKKKKKKKKNNNHLHSTLFWFNDDWLSLISCWINLITLEYPRILRLRQEYRKDQCMFAIVSQLQFPTC